MSSFTDEDREHELRRRQRQPLHTPPLLVTCLHCQRTVPAADASSAMKAFSLRPNPSRSAGVSSKIAWLRGASAGA